MTQSPLGARLSTHVLDTARGRPAAGILVRVEHLEGAHIHVLGEIETDTSGRIADLVEGGVEPGWYRLTFDARGYLSSQGIEQPFLGRITVEFETRAGEHHYHVPLLLSAYSAACYRGS